ncbi:MAG TPA: glutathione S-transferase family protein [Gammaproteobacteria bacterium]|nr:glutathione S-transferase family protein [Gammaproteobacteria bacterium]
MGRLVNGEWTTQWYDTEKTGGKFVREDSNFRHWITPDGEGDSFKAEPGRYHLYVSWACPWAHRTLIFRKLKKLEDVIDVSVVHWFMGDDGWTFKEEDGATGDTLYGKSCLHEIYTLAKPDYTGRVVVPVLWDKQNRTIVNNESADIIRILNSAFDEWGDADVDFYPVTLRDEIDAINQQVYHNVNNGVYKAGFATSQAAYEEAVKTLFDTLDMLENRLAKQDWLVGGQITEADWRLFTTLVRFDAVYYSHFKCNLRRIRDYPHLHAYLERLYAIPDVAQTVHMDHIKNHYYGSHPTINPTGIVPLGPAEPI